MLGDRLDVDEGWGWREDDGLALELLRRRGEAKTVDSRREAVFLPLRRQQKLYGLSPGAPGDAPGSTEDAWLSAPPVK